MITLGLDSPSSEFSFSFFLSSFFFSFSPVKADNAHIVELMSLLGGAKLDVIKTENLYDFDGKPGYSLGQGQ